MPYALKELASDELELVLEALLHLKYALLDAPQEADTATRVASIQHLINRLPAN